MTKRALILGIGGQDGSYLCDLLSEKGYEVHGLYRRSSVDNLWRIRHCLDRVTLHRGDVCDAARLSNVIDEVAPDEIYNEADQDNVGWSCDAPGYQVDVSVKAVGSILEALRYMGGRVRFFQPLSATMFGNAPPPQNEQTPFAPASPYACAKVAAHYLCQHYRREHGVLVSTAIFFNHDSPRRGGDYLLQRIARGEKLWGNLDTVVDVGYAPEYMAAAWQILQLDKADDFVIGTGRGYRIADLVYDRNPHPVDKPSGLCADTRKAWEAFRFLPTHDAAMVLDLLRSKA